MCPRAGQPANVINRLVLLGQHQSVDHALNAAHSAPFEGGFQGDEPPLMAGLQLAWAVQEGEQEAGSRLPDRDGGAAIPGGFEKMLAHRFVTEEPPSCGASLI